jgi:Cof subfamily protein (haloacid dehalogenase superfamily)
MARRAVFLDVDGTYVNSHGLVPESARQAVIRARANGHLVYLCTGRSMAGLSAVLEAGFDGVIASAGRYVEVGGAVLVHRSVPVEDVREVVEFFDARGVEYYLEANSGYYGSRGVKPLLRELVFGGVTDAAVLAALEKGVGGIFDSFVTGADPLRTDINTIVFIDSPVPHDEVAAIFGDRLTVDPSSVRAFGPRSGEISVPGLDKATAIELLIRHVGVAWEDTVGYGDGHNDLEMIRYVRTGVAMGNAHPDVTAAADAVTGDPDDDGIHTSFAALGLI